MTIQIMKKTKSIFFILSFLVLGLGAAPSWASGILQANITQTASQGKYSEIEVHHVKGYNAWLYIGKDGNGVDQVFLQQLDARGSTPQLTTPLQLTSSSTAKSSPRWGGVDENFTYYSEVDTPKDCQGGFSFYYLSEATSGSKNIEIGCLTGLSQFNPVVVFAGGQITASGVSGQDLNVAQFDTSKGTSTYFRPTASSSHDTGLYIVFTTTDGVLHFLIHNYDVNDANNMATPQGIIVLDPNIPGLYDTATNGWMYEYRWASYVNWQSTASETLHYSHPRFDDNNHRLITFQVRKSSDTHHQIGVTNIFANIPTSLSFTNYYILTDTTYNLKNPQFVDGSDSQIIFEIENYQNTSSEIKDVIATIGLDTNVDTTSTTSTVEVNDWDSSIRIISDGSAHRRNVDTRIASAQQGLHSYNLAVTYTKQSENGLKDIYFTFVSLASGSTISPGTQPASSLTEDFKIASFIRGASDSIYSERQVTCMHDDDIPKFLGSYLDINYSVDATETLSDIVFVREMFGAPAVSGDNYIAQAYDIRQTTTECADTCYENGDGSIITDSNGLDDGDGYADRCESLPCNADTLLAFAQDGVINDNDDYDRDGIRNDNDNCPCTYNPTQHDADGDGVGDEYLVDTDGDGVIDVRENGCDSCPTVSNPATDDHNGDGLIDFLDGDLRQTYTDTDADGIPDICEEAPDTIIITEEVIIEKEVPVGEQNECGTIDRDGDGINDGCDNCPLNANSDQLDEDNNGIGDVCEINRVGQVAQQPIEYTMSGGANCSLGTSSTASNLSVFFFLLTLIPLAVRRLRFQK